MKFLAVVIVFVCMLFMSSQVSACYRIKKVIRLPIHITQKTILTAVSPVRTIKKNISCRVEARKCRRVARRCN